MSFSQTIKGRMTAAGYHVKFPAVRAAIHRALDIVEQTHARAGEIRNHPDHSEQGKSKLLREHAASAAPTLGRVQRAIAEERGKVEIARAALRPKFPKVSEAMQLALAAKLDRMTDGQKAAALAAPDVEQRLLATVFEMPHVLHGTSQDLLLAVEKKLVEAAHGPELAQLADHQEAIDLAEGATRAAKDAVLEVSGHAGSPVAAERWLAQLIAPSAADRNVERTEAARHDAERIAYITKSMPVEIRDDLVTVLHDQNISDRAVILGLKGDYTSKAA
jgi:hypothetical protein